MNIAGLLQVKEFVDVLFNFNNPIYYSILATVFIVVLVYFFYYYIIFPLNKKHILEKKELELKQVRLMALFADLDPDPVLRVDNTGKIIYTNNAARDLPEFSSIEGEGIDRLLPGINAKIPEIIKSNSYQAHSAYINQKYYMITLRGNLFLNIAQIYLHDISDRKKFENRLKYSRKKLRYLSHHLINVIEDERQRIASELHDSIGQNMLFLKMKLQNMGVPAFFNENNDEYDSLISLFESTIKDLRNVIYDLKPKILEEMGLAPALLYLCDRVSVESKIEGKVDVTGYDERIELKKEIALYRVVQEALNNIIKHSGARHFNVQLLKGNKVVRIIISDDGKGFDSEKYSRLNNMSQTGGYGLLNMRERISNLNGIFKIDSSLNAGTIIITEIPLRPEDERT
jgi:two-component system sensor histidine kinase DegS